MEADAQKANSHLSKLIEQTKAEEDAISAESGKPLVRIEPVKPVLGSARGTFVLTDGWDDPLTDDELKDLFGI
jgi:antitoxin (DNA-binding transcriptional repressor) of toxin-antitoxin stability system